MMISIDDEKAKEVLDFLWAEGLDFMVVDEVVGNKYENPEMIK